MSATVSIKVRDENFSGQVLNETRIGFKTNTVSLRELIEERVRQEVMEYNDKTPEYFKGLVAPTNAEKTLNGYKIKKKIMIDPEKQVYVALDAFQKNAFFVLINNQQHTHLNDQVQLSDDTTVSFIKLTPLVGG